MRHRNKSTIINNMSIFFKKRDFYQYHVSWIPQSTGIRRSSSWGMTKWYLNYLVLICNAEKKLITAMIAPSRKTY
jgi:hypothetical protein